MKTPVPLYKRDVRPPSDDPSEINISNLKTATYIVVYIYNNNNIHECIGKSRLFYESIICTYIMLLQYKYLLTACTQVFNTLKTV